MKHPSFSALLSGEKGSALLVVIWVTLIISTLLLAVSDRLQMDRTFYTERRDITDARQTSREFFQYIILYLQEDDTRYDTLEEMSFPLDRLGDEVYSGVEIQLWDEGSRLNPNNTPLPLLSAYFHDEMEVFELIRNRLFSPEGNGDGGYDLIVRNDYFLSKAELSEIFTKEQAASGVTRGIDLSEDLTVFAPAIFALIDGEVLCSLLLRWGEDYNHTSALSIINNFNQTRNELKSMNDFSKVASRLHLDLMLEEEVIEDLLSMEGVINPNFVSPRLLAALFREKNKEINEDFYDLEEFRKDNPFTEQSFFDYYLQTLHGIPIISEEIWKVFTLETKIWGVRMRVPISAGRYIQTTAVLRRERDELGENCLIKVLFYQEEIKKEAAGSGRNYGEDID